jgi:hypothetical protein
MTLTRQVHMLVPELVVRRVQLVRGISKLVCLQLLSMIVHFKCRPGAWPRGPPQCMTPQQGCGLSVHVGGNPRQGKFTRTKPFAGSCMQTRDFARGCLEKALARERLRYSFSS